MHELAPLGFDERIAALASVYAKGGALARVVRSDRGFVFAADASGIVVARPSTRLIKNADDGGLPVVGDWVVIGGDESEPIVETVLPRFSAIERRDPGRESKVQVLAADVDVVFITAPITEGANLARIERELALVWDSRARPVLVLTKADTCEDPDSVHAEAAAAAPGVPVHVTSAVTGQGIEELRQYVAPGTTVALIGPSGSGKSTLINSLAGEDMRATRDVRVSDGRGRHTTVSRELVPLPGGGLMIDTPGLRAVGMWDSGIGLDQAFSDIAELAGACRFRDCLHGAEPGCAVTAAVEAGELPERRLENYRQLQAEVRHVVEQRDVRAREAKKREDKELAKTIKRYYKHEEGRH